MTGADLTVAKRPVSRISRSGRDYLLLNICVLFQHGYLARAESLVEALYATGDRSAEVSMARAVLRFSARDWRTALARLDELDRIDPVERFGSYRLTERQRMRRYMRTRCLFELRDNVHGREAREIYLRHSALNQ